MKYDLRFSDFAPITAREALDYELHSSWWVRYISNPRLQDLAARYFAWKVNRKHGRYCRSMAMNRAVQFARAAAPQPGANIIQFPKPTNEPDQA